MTRLVACLMQHEESWFTSSIAHRSGRIREMSGFFGGLKSVAHEKWHFGRVWLDSFRDSKGAASTPVTLLGYVLPH